MLRGGDNYADSYPREDASLMRSPVECQPWLVIELADELRRQVIPPGPFRHRRPAHRGAGTPPGPRPSRSAWRPATRLAAPVVGLLGLPGSTAGGRGWSFCHSRVPSAPAGGSVLPADGCGRGASRGACPPASPLGVSGRVAQRPRIRRPKRHGCAASAAPWLS